MAPKFDPNEVKYVYVRLVGNEAAPSSVLAQKVGDDIMKAIKEWAGIRVTVQLAIQNRQAKCSVMPNATSLIIKELKEPPRDRKKVKNILHNGNLSMDTIYKVARIMREKSIARKFEGTVKEILGTCFAVGCTVDGMNPREVHDAINNGEIECPEE